jgi:putative hemolysin
LKRVDNPLSYARADMTGGEQFLLRLVERSHGIERASRRYRAWQSGFDLYQGDAMNRLLAACDIRLDLRGGAWPPACRPGRPLLMIANHPFGVPDGVAALALAEQIGRPVKILIHSDLLRIPEMARFALPIDFSETREALRVNAASGREAIARLKSGETIMIFPAGGIATAGWALGRACDLPWKTFVAKLVHKAQADVVPLYFSGQNSWMFQAASQVSMFLRMSLILPEALRRIGRDIEVCVGDVVPYEQMAGMTDRHELTAMLRRRVFALCPGAVSADKVGRIGAMKDGRQKGKNVFSGDRKRKTFGSPPVPRYSAMAGEFPPAPR